MQNKKPSKFNYDQITVKNDHSRPFTETITLINSKKICICNNYNQLKVLQCFKCKSKVHYCVKVMPNRPQIHSFECLSCLAKAMDLVYEPQTILLETFYKTQNIFERANIINFEFDLRYEDTKFPVDIRGFKGNKIQLVWPMQGQFILNGFKETTNSLKPLKSNSNRKNRKEECYLIEPKYLKEGKNTLTFKIPRLEKNIVLDKYQYEETGVYFIAIYSVKQLKTNDVLNITKKQRRFQKHQTLELFRQGDEDVPAQKQKVRLIDPYTSERIKFPVRGRYCTHLAAVCLLSYVEFQKVSRSWKCPVCSIQSNSFLNEPYLDMWMYEILQDNLKGENVFIRPNGTYEWETMKENAVNLDSDEDDVDRPQNLPDIIEEQQAVINELQIFDIESNNQQQSNPHEIDLIDYNEVGQTQNNPQNDFWNHRQPEHSEGQLSQMNELPAHQKHNFDGRSAIGEPIIEEFHQILQLQSDSNSEFDFPFNNNDYVPSSRLENVKVQQTPIQPEKKDPAKTPEIYTIPLEVKNKKHSKKPQMIDPKNLSPDLMNKMNIMKEKLLQKKGQTNQQAPITNQPQTTMQPQNKPKIQSLGKDKFIGDKRLIHRPTYIQTMAQRSQLHGSNLSHPIKIQHPFGTVPKKNIELSQQRMHKSQPKIEPGLAKFFPLPPQKSQKIQPVQKKAQQLKKSQSVQIIQPKSEKKDNSVPVQKPKPPKIKTIKVLQCPSISYSKFAKDYCRIPNPTLFRRLTQDMKTIFASIL